MDMLPVMGQAWGSCTTFFLKLSNKHESCVSSHVVEYESETQRISQSDPKPLEYLVREPN